jgi:hypothetical protein
MKLEAQLQNPPQHGRWAHKIRKGAYSFAISAFFVVKFLVLQSPPHSTPMRLLTPHSALRIPHLVGRRHKLGHSAVKPRLTRLGIGIDKVNRAIHNLVGADGHPIQQVG